MKRFLFFLSLFTLLLAFSASAETDLHDLPDFMAPSETIKSCTHIRTVPEDFIYQVQNEEPLGDEAFENAMMIGDSITDSMNDYDVLPTLDVQAYIGQSPIAAHKIRNMRYKDRSLSMFELAVEKQPGILIILLGGNGLDQSKFEKVATDYHELIDDLIDNLPETDIYLMAITPIRQKAENSENMPKASLQRTEAFNEFLLELAHTHGIRYIDSYTPLLEDDGIGLKKDYSMPDGIHFNTAGATALGNVIRLGVLPHEEE